MPELPEVETIRRDLERSVVGRTIASVEVTGARSVRRQPVAELVAHLVGRAVTAVDRRGKYLLLVLDSGDAAVVHLRMSGQLLLAPASDPRPKHTHVVAGLDHGDELRFVDPRTFGEWFVVPGGADPPAAGVDALAIPSWQALGDVLRRRRRLKDLLMDQRVIAGIGNIYSDEILWTARLRHDRMGSSLTGVELRRLHAAIRSVLDEAIEHRGSSLADEQYRDLFGRVGGYAALHRVFAREGQPCLRCARPIARVRHAGRSHFSCPRCQR